MNTQHIGTTVPNVGIAAARPKPRGKRATLAAAVVSAGLTLFGLGLAAGTAQATPGPLPTDLCEDYFDSSCPWNRPHWQPHQYEPGQPPPHHRATHPPHN
jgi:hypothetical protein